MKKSVLIHITTLAVIAAMCISCDDGIPADSLYTYKKEMLSGWLQNNADFSEFAAVVTKSGRMDLLATYGTYTCFAPTNEAMQKFYKEQGIRGIQDLTVEDCDTIARTAIVDVIYMTADFEGLNFIEDANMLGRNLSIESKTVLIDDDSVTTYRINRSGTIIYQLCNDSVENGVVHPVDAVLLSSNATLPYIMKEDTAINLFNICLEATGLDTKMQRIKDTSYDPRYWREVKKLEGSYYTGAQYDYCVVPEYRNFGYTVFAVPDSILRAEYGITNLVQMYKYACTKYTDGVGETWYGNPDIDEASFTDADFGDLKDERNPLYRLIAYHCLDRKGLYDKLYTNCTIYKNDINPTEWYNTMNPFSTLKVEFVYAANKFRGTSTTNSLYLNRMYDPDKPNLTMRGAKVEPTVHEGLVQQAVNGIYYYIDRMIDYGQETQEKVFNARMRMDLYTFWPELMNNDLRTSRTYGNLGTNDPNADAINYIFPQGYFENVETSEDGDFFLQNCRNYFWSYQGDEFNLRSDNNSYDITFRLPSVPAGTYQIRLGFCQMENRGIAQFYVDGQPQGIPLDMRYASDYGWEDKVGWKSIENLKGDALEQAKKDLHNHGYYHGPKSVRFVNTGANSVKDDRLLSTSNSTPFAYTPRTIRKVIYTGYLDPTVWHTMRIKSVLAIGGAELMIDYIEIVPKSVYGIEGEGKGEDDL